jgi:ribosomal protein L27
MPSTGGPSGHIKSKQYVDTKGLKVGAGELVKTGTILTRQGNKWKAGNNVGDSGTLYALCNGKVYFTKRRGSLHRTQTYINVMPSKITKEKDPA